MKAVKVIGFILFGLLVVVAAAGTYVKVALPDTGTAPQIKIERTAERIKRGDYLADIFIQRFKSFEGKEKQAAKLNPGDPQIPMPWYLYAGMKAPLINYSVGQMAKYSGR